MLSSPALSRPARYAFSERAQVWRAADTGACGYRWAAAAPHACLLLLHGLRSHAQWFAEGADELAAGGVSVYALDRRGSGSSAGTRGDIERYDQWLDEIASAVALARGDHPALPIHVLGHCFGANLALAYCLTRPGEVASLVMLTPGLYIKPGYTPLEKLEIAVAAALAGSHRFRMPQEDAMFTRDPEVLAWIEADRLGARSLTARCLLQIQRLGARIRRDLADLDLPVLVLAAGRDRISDNARSQQLLSAALGRRCHWQTFDAEHFLLAEPCREQVVSAVLGWIENEVILT